MGSVTYIGGHRAANRRPGEELEKERAKHGTVAWERLCSRSRPRLSKADRMIVASNLHDAVTKARLDPNELVRTIWPADPRQRARGKYRCFLPGNLAEKQRTARLRELIADKWVYRRLIEEYVARTKEDRNRVADRILFGTSLHPTVAADLSETEGIHTLLQQWLGRLDVRHGLLDRYRAFAESRLELLESRGCFVPGSGVPRLNGNGGVDAENWRELVPYLPHAFIGVADQFDWEFAWSDERYWPLPDDIEYGIASRPHVAERHRNGEEWRELDALEKELAGSSAKDEALLRRVEQLQKNLREWDEQVAAYRERLEQARASMRPGDVSPAWREWHDVFMRAVAARMPDAVRVSWQETANGPAPCLEGGAPLASLDLGLREARQDYFLRLAEALERAGVAIPDSVFVGARQDLDNQLPMLQLVRQGCELAGRPLPDAARALLERDEELRETFDGYCDVIASPLWLTICLSEDGETLVPTVLYSMVEPATGDRDSIWAYAIDGPKALREVDDYLYFGIAWPSAASCYARIREMVASGLVEAEWARTAAFVEHHPYEKRYQDSLRIRRMLQALGANSSEEQPHAD